MVINKNDIINLKIIKSNYEDFEYLDDSAVNELKDSLSKCLAVVCQYIAEHPENLRD